MSKKKKNIEELLEEAVVPDEEQPYEVPENWVWTKLGCVFEQVKEQIQPTGNEKYIGLEHMNKGGGILEVGNTEGVKSKKVVFKKNDVLYGKLRPYLNKHAHVEFDGVASTDILVYRNKNIRANKLLNMYLWLPQVLQYANENSNGINLPRVSPKAMDNMHFPLPPLSEQKRIAEKVERFLSKIEEAKQLIEEAKETFELRRAAILDKAFHGELTRKWREENQCDKLEPIEQSGNLGPFKLPHGWEWKKLGEIGELQRGKSKHRPRNDPKLFGGEYPFIQTGDVARSSDYVEDFSQTLSEFGYNQSKLFPIGTVCITIAANIADTAILKFPCCFPDSVVGFVPFEEIVSSEFVHYYISTIKNDLEHYAPATAQKNINLKILNEVLVPVPSLREHEVIMDKIKNLLDKEYEASQYLFLENSIELLKQSILSKAFRGELGTNDPSEENAIELLKEVLREQVK
ncbi:restriction endonuclease subunit S [Bacillus atrophaeus]|uniref:restriction endonuclease subunit S n=1 Tax=Bacillus atrophaeus TaxID=1452 RepID=UPI002DB5FE49|nr:restriction endonuclease subunit S [Bacillus atrophaeus]MEC0766211.1 restriction endonuclease subunit S [Bacillus atrophaeus]MEC0778456.1 restriction endonuclease subunit S [Bacillus atrophaeus]MEC0808492.1 restriction endonuclease subunit S [Bacillus atrophaeus]